MGRKTACLTKSLALSQISRALPWGFVCLSLFNPREIRTRAKNREEEEDEERRGGGGGW